MHVNVSSTNKIVQMSIITLKESHSHPPKNNNLLTQALYNFHHGHANLLIAILFLLMQTTPPATAQMVPPPPGHTGKKSVAGVMVVVAVLFFISGFLSLYTRQCCDQRTRIRGRFDLSLPIGDTTLRSEPQGLNPEVIGSFPTFPYAAVKRLMVAKGTLACAVCLDEFQDDETLRLIPKCSHVFHPTCIDVWLESHSTCPVCRANLVPRSEEVAPFVAIDVPDDQEHQDDAVGVDHVESPKENVLRRSRTMNQNRTTRSRSTGFLFSVLFPRSNSTGHSVMVRENSERFTLRLPEEVRSKLLLKRASSCVSFRRMSSGRRGFRTRSVGSGRGRNYLGRFHGEEQWGFTLTPPFFTWARSARESPVLSSAVASGDVFGEQLCPGLLASQGT